MIALFQKQMDGCILNRETSGLAFFNSFFCRHKYLQNMNERSFIINCPPGDAGGFWF